VAEVVVTLRRQEGSSEDECAEFLWCLLHRVGLGREVPLPENRDMLVAPLIQDITINQTQDLESARQAVAKAAEACNKQWERYYAFAGAQPAPPPDSADPVTDEDDGEWKGYAPLSE
jgi:hypothetical protein